MAPITVGSPLRHLEHQLAKRYWLIYSEFPSCSLKQANYPRQQQSYNLQHLISPPGNRWLRSEPPKCPPSLYNQLINMTNFRETEKISAAI